MAFYLYLSFGRKRIVEAENRAEARIKFGITHVEMRNCVSLATEKEIEEVLGGVPWHSDYRNNLE